VTLLDVIVLGWIGLSAAQGARRGLVVNGLGLIGFVAGAIGGSRLAPHLLPRGAQSPWLPTATMVAAVVVGLTAQSLAGAAAGLIRSRILRGPLATVDAAGGLALGTMLGIALVWLAAVVAIQQPALGLRRDVQRSAILPVLLRAMPATTVLNAIARFDPLPVLPPALADRALPAPVPGVLRTHGVQEARLSTVQIVGTACGLGIQGSGWVVRPGLVATNAHVVAGEHGQMVELAGHGYAGSVVALDAGNDVALIRVPGLPARPLRMAPQDPSGGPVALIGFPQGGGLTAVPGRAGRPVTVLAPDAYGSNVHARDVVPLRGRLRHGDSGGPVVDPAGRVVAMMFAAASSGQAGFGVPLDAVRALARGPLHHVSTGGCVQ
jgi:S1-C subfamily serine protease